METEAAVDYRKAASFSHCHWIAAAGQMSHLCPCSPDCTGMQPVWVLWRHADSLRCTACCRGTIQDLAAETGGLRKPMGARPPAAAPAGSVAFVPASSASQPGAVAASPVVSGAAHAHSPFLPTDYIGDGSE